MTIVALTSATSSATDGCGNWLAGLRSTQWRNTLIPVCWEDMKAAETADREVTREAVARTWERHSQVRFTGWDQCRPNARGIRIRVEDGGEPPRTYGLGSQLDGAVDGMRLNFRFTAWSQTCRNTRERCIGIIAVHEFGHALGFTHEQNRPEAPGWCRADVQGANPDALLTSYDPSSVMNYCNPRWSNEGILSEQDIAGLQAWYGHPESPASRYAGRWTATFTYSDPGCQADAVAVTILNGAVTGHATTPQGLVVQFSARIDDDSGIQNMEFDFSPVDHVVVTGAFPHALVRSTDCGCGAITFARVGR